MSAAKPRPSLRDRIDRDTLFQTSPDLPRVVEIDVAVIAPNPEQPRRLLDPDALEDLKTSIERHGLLQPILVRREAGVSGFVLVAGQRRLAAIAALGRSTVAAIVTGGDPGEVALVENLQREDLSPFDEAEAVARLMARHGYSQAVMGQVLGKKQNTVSALLALTRLPDRIRQEYPTTSRITKSLLIEIAQIADPPLQLKLWEEAKRGTATVRGARAARALPKPRPAGRPSPAAGRVVAAGERFLRDLQGVHSTSLAASPKLLARLATVHLELGQLLAAARKSPG
jgi:ParB family chromosome partitioning protein